MKLRKDLLIKNFLSLIKLKFKTINFNKSYSLLFMGSKYDSYIFKNKI